MAFSGDQLNTLVTSPDYREFLKRAFFFLEKSKHGFSYAGFARKAGLSSRSFPRDVVMGAKRLTIDSATAFSNALEIKGEVKKFFLLLVESESGRVQEDTLKKTTKQLDQTRNRLLSKVKRTESTKLSGFVSQKLWFDIYAALGTASHGASLDEVMSRSGIGKSECLVALTRMVNEGVATQDLKVNRYFPGESHVILNHLGKENAFKELYLDGLKQLQKKAAQNFESQDELYFNSSFSISQSKMKAFRSELRDLMLQFIDQSEDPNGDRIARINLGFSLIGTGS